MLQATTAIVLDKRRLRQDGTYPVKLRITHDRKQRYYSTKVSLTESDFDRVMGLRPRKEFKEVRIRLQAVEQKAVEAIQKIADFSFDIFESNFRSKSATTRNVFDAFDEQVSKLNEEGRVSTAYSYKYSQKSLRKFIGREHLGFAEITPQLLQKYESWMVKNGKSMTSVGIYLRALRTMVNEAIAKKILDKESYPFGKYGYQIPAGRNVKKALTLKQIGKIFKYEAEPESTEEYHRDLWIFSYLCNGINFKDIARLKYKNIDQDRVIFIRSKTERTSKKNLKPIVATLLPEAIAIIDKWGQHKRDQETNVFPILEKNCTPQREMALVRQVIKMNNTYMRRIAEAVGIDMPVTTYTARHSCATVLKRSGAPIEFISESLGHKDLKTTENYLDSFEDDVRKEYSKKLTAF